MWWNNLKMKLVMGVAVIMVILIIFLLICFGSGHSCVRKGSKNSQDNTAAPSTQPADSPQPVADAAGGRRLLMHAAGQAAQALMASW